MHDGLLGADERICTSACKSPRRAKSACERKLNSYGFAKHVVRNSKHQLATGSYRILKVVPAPQSGGHVTL